MAILVITMVNVQCCHCRASITKILESHKEEFCIEKIEFEEKLNKVIVRGKFDGEKLKKAILDKAGETVKIKEIALVDKWPPQPDPVDSQLPASSTCPAVPAPALPPSRGGRRSEQSCRKARRIRRRQDE